jgi:hypothetical protein
MGIVSKLKQENFVTKFSATWSLSSVKTTNYSSLKYTLHALLFRPWFNAFRFPRFSLIFGESLSFQAQTARRFEYFIAYKFPLTNQTSCSSTFSIVTQAKPVCGHILSYGGCIKCLQHSNIYK